MRLWIFLLLTATASPALAADDFGARFTGQAPEALSAEDSVAAALQDIEPAAGDEQDSAGSLMEEQPAGALPEAGAKPPTAHAQDSAPIVRIRSSGKP